MNKNIPFGGKGAFSIIEVMVAIFVFTLGLSAVFMVLHSTGNINAYNKNFIIASNLAREQIELIRNTRDTNYEMFQKWNTLQPTSTVLNKYNIVFTGSTSEFYKFENNYSGGFHIKVETDTYIIDFETQLKNNDANTKKYQLCLNSDNRYIYCNGSTGLKLTPFYRYIEIRLVGKNKLGDTTTVKNALKIQSKVFWNHKGVHQTEIETILTDWQRL